MRFLSPGYIAGLLAVAFCVPGMRVAHAYVGGSDSRKYLDWDQAPYDKIVMLKTEYAGGFDVSVCTAQYVHYDILLTARHCVTKNKTGPVDDSATYAAILSNGRRVDNLKIISYGKNHDFNRVLSSERVDDWALLRIPEEEYYKKDFFNVPDKQSYGDVVNAGFGFLRILDDDEIQTIREVFKQFANSYYIENKGRDATEGEIVSFQLQNFSAIMARVKDNLKLKGIDSLDDTVTITDPDTGHSETGYRFKVSKDCKLNNFDKDTGFVVTDCDNASGNSGGPYFSDKELKGIVSAGQQSWDDEYSIKYTIPVTAFYTALETAKNESPTWPRSNTDSEPVVTTDAGTQTTDSEPVVATTDAGTQTTDTVQTNLGRAVLDGVRDALRRNKDTTKGSNDKPVVSIDELPPDLAQKDNELATAVARIDSMTNGQFLDFLNSAVEYSVAVDNYLAARAREQSTANKLLGAVSVGAAGIGGMMLASGLAEQRADADAERDMRAYLETMRCDYGAGMNIKGGETNIELPGGNELAPMITEYKTLAADLKIRKDALGLAAGIESELVLDSAETGLYENAAIGKTGGAYVSLSRALMDEDSEDATQWAEQKEAAQQKTKTGAIVGGAGAGIGLVGNVVESAVYNKKDDKK